MVSVLSCTSCTMAARLARIDSSARTSWPVSSAARESIRVDRSPWATLSARCSAWPSGRTMERVIHTPAKTASTVVAAAMANSSAAARSDAVSALPLVSTMRCA